MLTGMTRYRLNWRKKVILQVSEWQRSFALGRHLGCQPWIAVWRDATFRDVIDLAEGHITRDKPASPMMPPPPKPKEAH